MSAGPRKIRSEWWAQRLRDRTRTHRRSSGVSPAEIAAVGVTGMLPAVVLLDSAGRLLASEHPAERRALPRRSRTSFAREIDEKAFLAKAGNGINQQLVDRQASLDRAPRTRGLRAASPPSSAPTTTSTGALPGERAIEQNWALEAGFVDFKSRAIDDALVALAAYSARGPATQGRLTRHSRRRLGPGRGGKRT